MSETLYELDQEIAETAESLCARYGLHLGHVDLSGVVFTRKHGPRPKKSQIGEISVVKGYARQRLEEHGDAFGFEFCVWSDAWDEIDPSVRQLLLFHALYSISPGSLRLRQPDVIEHGPICEYFGPYWRGQPVVECLLGGEDALPLPLPPDDESDSGSTGNFESLY